MNSNNKENLLEHILEKYKELLKILKTEGDESVSFAKDKLKRDIMNIEETLAGNISQTDFNEILHLVKANYSRMYPVRGGLTEFFVWRDDFDERMKANKLLNEIKAELKDIFDKIS
jgi:hypothetical protein